MELAKRTPNIYTRIDLSDYIPKDACWPRFDTKCPIHACWPDLDQLQSVSTRSEL